MVDVRDLSWEEMHVRRLVLYDPSWRVLFSFYILIISFTFNVSLHWRISPLNGPWSMDHVFRKTIYTYKNHPIPQSTEIFKQYCRNIPWKYCKISKIFRNLSLILLKYCNNLAMSAQNMTYAIFSKSCQNQQMNKQYFLK